ncbi:hypothetical protein [Dechloromonas sp. ZS-1]|uniref:hypothetical protein n=1 Tax=Dechloromonas sp. ZS-1 TaxID=3138067 RepID=UPI0031FD5FA3
MKKPIELTDDEFTKLATAVAGLPFIRPMKWETCYVEDVMHTVLNFHIQEPVVINALNFFQLQVQKQHHINDHHQLKGLLAKFPNDKYGNEAAAMFLWSNRHWTRIELLRRLLDFFESIGVTDQLSLHAWIKSATFEADFKGKVKGLGIAVWEWLRIRCGIDSIKPDVWVINFAKRVVGKRISEKALVDTFGRISPLVGESLNTIDVTIWYYEKLAMATDDNPELRLIAWNMLKNELEAKLRDEVLREFNWQLVLDERQRLRFEQAGLMILPDRSLFGETVPGTTSACIRQSSWEKGLQLEMLIQHDTSLPLALFQKLQENLAAQDWEASNEPYFSASLDFQEDMKITPPMTIAELAVWASEFLRKASQALTTSVSGFNSQK